LLGLIHDSNNILLVTKVGIWPIVSD